MNPYAGRTDDDGLATTLPFRRRSDLFPHVEPHPVTTFPAITPEQIAAGEDDRPTEVIPVVRTNPAMLPPRITAALAALRPGLDSLARQAHELLADMDRLSASLAQLELQVALHSGGHTS